MNQKSISLSLPSEEQLDIINSLKEYNVIVDAVAGSGKTTTILNIAKTYTDAKILNLVYNKHLEHETDIKIKKYGITNLDSYTYHGFCKKYFKMEGYTDEDIKKCLDNGVIPIKNKWDIIIIDEAQDIIDLYFRLICVIFKFQQCNHFMIKGLCNNCKMKTKICVLGDKFQSIYNYKGSDSRFLIMADIIFSGFNDYKWVTKTLSVSFRLTKPMADFLNNCVLNDRKIQTNKDSAIKVKYYCWDLNHLAIEKLMTIVNKIKFWIKNGEYSLNDFLILSYSCKTKAEWNPICRLANLITDHTNFPIYISNNEDEKANEKELEGKIAFLTFHQSKGLERKVVIILGFDMSYYEMDKNNKNNECTNILYVALTRSTERLYLIHNRKRIEEKNILCLPFLNIEKLIHYCEIYPSCIKKILTSGTNIDYNKKNKTNWSVTDLISHIPYNILYDINNLLNYKIVNESDYKIPSENEVEFYNGEFKYYESVSNIKGISLNIFYQLLSKQTPKELLILNKNNHIKNIQKKEWNHRNKGTNENYYTINDFKEFENKDSLENFIITNDSIQKVLKLSNLWNSFELNLIFKLKQINCYNWFENDHIIEALDRYKKLIDPNNSIFEKKVEHTYNYKYKNKDKVKSINICGYIDIIDGNNIWELKFVNSITNEHKLQLACYAYLLENTIKKNNRHYYLFNSRNNECYELIPKNLEKVIDIILEYKMEHIDEITYNEFIKKINEIRSSKISVIDTNKWVSEFLN